LAFMMQSLSIWALTSEQPTRILRPSGDHTGLKSSVGWHRRWVRFRSADVDALDGGASRSCSDELAGIDG
jgi:hypothetical protein